MKRVVILIHGYNVSNPGKTVGKLRDPFEKLGCIVENHTYGYLPLPIQITRRNPRIARQVAGRCKYWKGKGYEVSLAVHSNGAAIARIAREIHSAPIDRILAIHPALRTTLTPAKGAKRTIVVFNGGDTAVVAGGWLGKISKWIMPKSWDTRPWGKMGQTGYNGTAGNVRNINTGETALKEKRCWGHSDEFEKGKHEYWLPFLAYDLINGRNK